MNRMEWGIIKMGLSGCKSVEGENGKMLGFSSKWREINPGNGERKGK